MKHPLTPALAALVLAIGPGLAHAQPQDRPVPRYGHVIVIMEENKDYAQILDPAVAPNIAGLAAKYGNATRFYGEVHPSDPGAGRSS